MNHYCVKYGMSKAELAGVTQAMLSEVDFWSYSHGCTTSSPLAQLYLIDLVKRDWTPFGSMPSDECNRKLF